MASPRLFRPHLQQLWYEQPARRWVDALPIGNGLLGAMVFGGIVEERLALNEQTLWSGGPREHCVIGAVKHLPELRQLIFEGKIAEAEALAARTILPPTQGSAPFDGRSKNSALAGQLQSYLPLGDLRLWFSGHEAAGDYHRQLDLDSALSNVTYRVNGCRYERESFASHPDNVIVLRLTCDIPGRLNCDLMLSSIHPNVQVETKGTTGLQLVGRLGPRRRPDLLPYGAECDAEWDGPGMGFETQVRLRLIGGESVSAGDRLKIRNADEAVLLLTAATSYVSPLDISGDPHQRVESVLRSISEKSLEEIRAVHVSDHQRLFRRVTLTLGEQSSSVLPTDRRIERHGSGEGDPGLAALLFDYGRYLLIASSRRGGLPATLQGLWNDLPWPPWGSKWTVNINTEMNYWLAEVCGLGECHEPLFDLIESLREPGHQTAHEHYGCNGFVLHHNTDIWRGTGPVDHAIHAWPMGAAWLCLHLWEHYQFTSDREFLDRRAYPLMKEAARFLVEFLVEAPPSSPVAGKLVTNPSMSPENCYRRADGGAGFLTYAATMDLAIIRELLGSCIKAARELNRDKDWQYRLGEVIEKLPPFQIGRYGQLQEWIQDWDDPQDHHRHNSHLFTVAPGAQITPRRTPELASAAAKSLDLRGDEGTGWALAWKSLLWSRLHDGRRAHKLLMRLLTPSPIAETDRENGGGIYPNLFTAHPPFQIDSNFGAAAAIAEMLLQSHDGWIELLPALPSAWSNGTACGLRARGCFTVDIAWRKEQLLYARIQAEYPGRCHIRYRDIERILELQPGQAARLNDELTVVFE